ncbi:MAG: flagellar protein FlaG [Firmicutes bacterium]|jgi:flagellar protein FlaG|nr:flagellar protein FlaG [Bacillota bacterium]
MKVESIDHEALERMQGQVNRQEVKESAKMATDVKAKQHEDDRLFKALPFQGDETFQAEMEKAIVKLNETAITFDIGLRFRKHESSGRWLVQVLNVTEDEIVREIPPEQVLNLVAQIQTLIGILLDERR